MATHNNEFVMTDAIRSRIDHKIEAGWTTERIVSHIPGIRPIDVAGRRARITRRMNTQHVETPRVAHQPRNTVNVRPTNVIRVNGDSFSSVVVSRGNQTITLSFENDTIVVGQ